MTAKNIKSKSVPFDHYDTPIWCAQECVDLVVPRETDIDHHVRNPLILEPGAGSGNILFALKQAMPNARIHAFDIRRDAGVMVHVKGIERKVKGWDFLKHGDPNADAQRWLDRFPAEPPSYDLAIGNPPFTYAREWVERCTLLARWTILLLRQGFLSSADRASFWKEYKPKATRILPDRPKFLKGKHGDTADYCWVIWKGHCWDGDTRLDWMPVVPLERRKRG